MSKQLLVSLAVSLLFLSNAYGQETAARVCADVPGQTSGTRRFQRLGETIEISLRRDVSAAADVDGASATDGANEANDTNGGGVHASGVDCEPVALDLHWSNGRNNGSNFNLTFLDSTNKPIYTKSFSGFLAGNLEFDLSSDDFRRVYASSMTVVSVPAAVRIQTVSPFAAPVSLSYTVMRVARATARGNGDEGNRVNSGDVPRTDDGRRTSGGNQDSGNQVMSIREVVRLIGAGRVPVVQIELKTEHPFPIKDVPLQLRIGKRVFVDELSGDHTGRKLTLSLTPEMFAALHDGDEIVASFGKAGDRGSSDHDVWYFGKLVKK
jgi:hypothetical protein